MRRYQIFQERRGGLTFWMSRRRGPSRFGGTFMSFGQRRMERPGWSIESSFFLPEAGLDDSPCRVSGIFLKSSFGAGMRPPAGFSNKVRIRREGRRAP